jgi:hypothetical protein
MEVDRQSTPARLISRITMLLWPVQQCDEVHQTTIMAFDARDPWWRRHRAVPELIGKGFRERASEESFMWRGKRMDDQSNKAWHRHHPNMEAFFITCFGDREFDVPITHPRVIC